MYMYMGTFGSQFFTVLWFIRCTYLKMARGLKRLDGERNGGELWNLGTLVAHMLL